MGDGSDLTVFGSWNASVVGGVVYGGGYVLLTIGNAASGILYSSSGATNSSAPVNVPISGSYLVSGTGPFVFTATEEKSGTFGVTLQGTILTW